MTDSYRLLVIDDDKMMRDALVSRLETLGHQVVSADSGVTGLKTIDRQAFDLVLTDLEMPGISGKALTCRLKERYPDLPVIVISVKNSMQSAIELLRLGAWDYLEKTPEGLQQLEAVLARVFERVRLLEENRAYKLRLEEQIERRTELLEQEKERYRLLFESAHDAIVLLKGDRIVNCNQRALQLFAVEADTMLGHSLLGFSPLLQPDDLYSDDMYALYCQRVCDGSPQNFEWRFKRHGGGWFDAEISLNGLVLGGETHFQALIRDVSERRQHLEELFRQAHFDELTNIPNRHRLNQTLATVLENLAITGGTCHLLLININKLQHINDTLGHDRGDELLQQLAQRLLPLCTFREALSRFVGNEFMLLATALPSDEAAEQLARQVFRLLEEPFVISGMDIFVSASIGICSYPQDGATVETLLKNVETALHQAKLQKRSRIQRYNRELSRHSEERLALENSLHRALERQEFELFYQPQLAMPDERIVGMEVLLRWQHPVEGMVSPVRFIPVLEESGLIIPVGRWVIRQACQQLRTWADQGLPPLECSLNISALQFHRGYLVETIRGALQEFGIDPRLLCLEVTESLIMDDVEQTIAIMEQLVELGVSLSIDDFGTGYSSLSYLRRMPIHELKIDRSFIISIPGEQSANAIVDTILGMAACLNLRVVAEGVEERAQRDYLAEKRCARIQGFYYSRPVPADEFARLLTEDTREPAAVDQR
ncbi:MAG: EAL domain-containing protein [Geobacter sp.]|nr:EAL domain-containing protein [Geobacter sp.]